MRFSLFFLMTAWPTFAGAQLLTAVHPTGISGDPVHISVNGLRQDDVVTLTTERRPLEGDRLMVSSATFRADANGSVLLDEQAPISGDYQGVDPGGLFWSEKPGRALLLTDLPRRTVRVQAFVGARKVDETSVHLNLGSQDLVSRPASGFPGAMLTYGPNTLHRPTVILLGGSECGDSAARDAPRLASRGFVVLGLPYCAGGAKGPTGLPTSFVDIPVDRLERVRDWLITQPEVDKDAIGLYGVSKGAEFALVAASRMPWVRSVVAVAPSDVVWEGWGKEVVVAGATSSFAWRGAPLPFVPYDHMDEEIAKMARGEPFALRGPHERGRALHPDLVKAAKIQVNDYKGPLLVIAGEDDQVWPSAQMARDIAATRRSAQLVTELLIYPNAGHALSGDGFASTLGAMSLGGTQKGLGRAQEDAWPKTIAFLHRTLDTAPTAQPWHTLDIRQSGFRGRLYVPTGANKGVGLVLIGGSEGHLYQAEETAPALAALGYTVLGVDYHDGYDGPRKLANVPIETFTSAVEWLRNSGRVDPKKVIVAGDSRGSEAALLTGSYDSNVAGVAAYVPSFVVWGALGSGDPKGPSGWSWEGRQLPFVPIAPTAPGGASAFTVSLQNEAATKAARIPVERIRGPVLLVGSSADAIWPSAQMAQTLADELKSAHFDYPVKLLIFDNASHRLLGQGPSPVSESYTYPGGVYTARFGGTAEGTTAARNQAWSALVNMLQNVAEKPILPAARLETRDP